MSTNNIFKDAENIVVKKNTFVEIGTKINKTKYPNINSWVLLSYENKLI